uniref:Chitin-binding type-2 domain-containing protein n=1 Tax=Cacopsylla melanoneura TaxID=428564 RepID=A0A8D8Y101_9HEMI
MKQLIYLTCVWTTLYTTCSAQQEYAQNPYFQSAGLAPGLAQLPQVPQSFGPPGPTADGKSRSVQVLTPSGAGAFLGAQDRQSPFGPTAFNSAFQGQPSLPSAKLLPDRSGLPGQLSSSVSCPERNIRYPNPQQCDAYVECREGVGKEELCPDGLLFNAKAPFGSYPCQYPQEVDCEGRSGRQPPNPTDQCPHQFGQYKMGDETQCGQFLNCANGAGFIQDCPEGLAFNEQSLQCDWPDQVANCNAEEYLGFTCPLTGNAVYDYEAVRFYRHPSDCQKYFHCVKGRPRLYSCGGNEAFNEFTSECDGLENVTSCASGGRPGGIQNLSNRAGFVNSVPNYNQPFGGQSNLVPDYNQPGINQPPNPFNQQGFNQQPSPFNQPSGPSGFGSTPSPFGNPTASPNGPFNQPSTPEYTPLPAYIQPPPPPSPFNRPGGSRGPGGRNGSPFNQRGGGFNQRGGGNSINGGSPFNQRGSRNFSPNQGGPFNSFRSSNPLTRRQIPFDSPNVRYARRN